MNQSMQGKGYPENWNNIAREVKARAGWRCIRCAHAHEPKRGYTLTVHHLDGQPQNCHWWNLAALCQRCHLKVQATINIAEIIDKSSSGFAMLISVDLFARSEWLKPFMAGYTAALHNLCSDQRFVMPQIDPLLAIGLGGDLSLLAPLRLLENLYNVEAQQYRARDLRCADSLPAWDFNFKHLARPKTQPKRIQRERSRGWRLPYGARIVTRGTRWGNKYQIGARAPDGQIIDRAMALALHKRDIDRDPFLRAEIRRDLWGADLCCWCSLDEACHADTLIEVANE